MIWSVLMDVMVAALLIATIFFAVRLNARLAVLRNDGERLQRLVQGLQDASGRAEEAVAGLKLTSADAGRTLQERIDQAGKLKADLGFILEKAEAVADRLEAALKAQREAALSAAAPEPATVPAGGSSRLATLLKQADAAAPRQEPSLEAGRARAAADPPARPAPSMPRAKAAPAPSGSGEPQRAEAPKSRAERELLRALENRR